MDPFLKQKDTLSNLIEQQAQILYKKIDKLPIDALNLPTHAHAYYTERHHKRKFFSVQTAAQLLYRSIKMKDKPVHELIIMDYGAGVGSLFLLAKMIGCKMVIYNDIDPLSVEAAQKITSYLEINIDSFICGDHKQTISTLKENHIDCDIILSRNVIEHIYDLSDFYQDMYNEQPGALLYFSTTANFHNPAMMLHHKNIHRRFEKKYREQRKNLILKEIGDIDKSQLEKLADKTRGLAMYDFKNALTEYQDKGVMPDPEIHYTNTCNPETGLWAEHIIPIKEYKNIIEPIGYHIQVLPAFWDTHYSSSFKSIVGKTMNVITSMLGDKYGLWTTAFIYIIVWKKDQK